MIRWQLTEKRLNKFVDILVGIGHIEFASVVVPFLLGNDVVSADEAVGGFFIALAL